MFWCMRLNCTFSLSKATCPQCGAKSQHTHMGVHDLRCTKTYSETCTHSHTLCSPSCNKWGPDCVWWWWWCKRPGMLVSMDDKLCWVNVECVLVCDYVASLWVCVWVCGSRGVKLWSTCSELLNSPIWFPLEFIVCCCSQSQTAVRGWENMFPSFYFLSTYSVCVHAFVYM